MTQESDIQRLKLIFRALAQGKVAAEIDGLLTSMERERRDARGYQSEERVKRILSGLPAVRCVYKVDRWSDADMQGKDLVVCLREEGIPLLERLATVSVQVKSSHFGIESYLTALQQRRHLSSWELTEYLKREKLILINGRISKVQIEHSFTHQLQEVRGFHLRKLLNS